MPIDITRLQKRKSTPHVLHPSTRFAPLEKKKGFSLKPNKPTISKTKNYAAPFWKKPKPTQVPDLDELLQQEYFMDKLKM